MENRWTDLSRAKSILFRMAVVLGLYLTSLYHYLLFHSLAEIFSIVVAFGLFIVAWNSRQFIHNNYLLFIGIAYLFVGLLDLIHTLAYKGMGIFQGYETNLPTQLWIISRYVESLSLLVAPFFFGRKLRSDLLFLAYAACTALLLGSVFHWEIFPACFVEGVGLTPFKKTSEYVICVILLASAVMLFRRRQEFDRRVFQWIAWSIALTIASELAFTFYVHAYGFSNLVGHYFKIASFYLMYKAIIETGLKRPYDLLFRELKQSEDAFRQSEERYRSLVELCPDSIAAHSEGRYLYVNPAGAKLLGASSPREIIGREVLSTIHPEDRDLVRSRIQQVEKEGILAPLRELKMIRLDGEAVDVEAAGTPITYQGKRAVQTVIRDITHRKQAVGVDLPRWEELSGLRVPLHGHGWNRARPGNGGRCHRVQTRARGVAGVRGAAERPLLAASHSP